MISCQRKLIPAKGNDSLSKEINNCHRKWFPVESDMQIYVAISKVNAGGETEIAISGGSDIIKCNELENV